MNLDDFFGPKPIVVELKAKDRWEAIDELVGHLVATNKIKADQKEGVLAAIKKRESALSTAIGYGIAIPHATTGLASDVVAAVGRSRKGIAFDALDGQPANLVILFLVPAGEFQKHVHTLANIAKLLHGEIRPFALNVSHSSLTQDCGVLRRMPNINDYDATSGF